MANLFQEENGALRVCAIHLAQAEERKRRFLEMNQIEGVHFVFVDGVDGRQLDLEELLRQNLMRPGTSRFTFSTLGSGLAHRATWLQAAASELPTLVCEDDAVFRKDFRRQFEACTKAIPGDWDLILLGYNFDSVLDAELIPGVECLRARFLKRPLGETELRRFQEATNPVSVLPLRNAFGLPAYAISPAGARHLLAAVFPIHNRPVPVPALSRTIISFSIDATMNGFYRDMAAYVCVPPLVVSPNQKDPHDREI